MSTNVLAFTGDCTHVSFNAKPMGVVLCTQMHQFLHAFYTQGLNSFANGSSCMYVKMCWRCWPYPPAKHHIYCNRKIKVHWLNGAIWKYEVQSTSVLFNYFIYSWPSKGRTCVHMLYMCVDACVLINRALAMAHVFPFTVFVLRACVHASFVPSPYSRSWGWLHHRSTIYDYITTTSRRNTRDVSTL